MEMKTTDKQREGQNPTFDQTFLINTPKTKVA